VELAVADAARGFRVPRRPVSRYVSKQCTGSFLDQVHVPAATLALPTVAKRGKGDVVGIAHLGGPVPRRFQARTSRTRRKADPGTAGSVQPIDKKIGCREAGSRIWLYTCQVGGLLMGSGSWVVASPFGCQLGSATLVSSWMLRHACLPRRETEEQRTSQTRVDEGKLVI